MLILKRLLLVLCAVLAAPYVLSSVYDFPAPRPFTGPAIWNPYARLSGVWRRTNLHAHGRAWSGLTNGHQTDAAVVNAYRRHGYDIAGVSDYERIAASDGVATLPLYEHGYNIQKAHQLAIGARRVEWLDFPLWQTLSQKQFLINRVSATADLLALNHPDTAYTGDDLRALTGYQLVEVLNGPFVYEPWWDAALSSGHVVWAIGDDDNHDVTYAPRLGVACSMIDARSTGTADVVSALGDGRAYAMSLRGATPDASLTEVTVRDSVLTVSIAGPPATFSFVGQEGVTRKTATAVTTSTYHLRPDDTYIRTVIRTRTTVMFLNPVIRYDGHALPRIDAQIDQPLTWAKYMISILACVTVASDRRSRQRPSRSATPSNGSRTTTT